MLWGWRLSEVIGSHESVAIDFFSHPALRAAAFSDEVLVDGLNSEVVEVDLDTLAVVRKADYRERRLQPLSVVRERIVEELRERNEPLLRSNPRERLIVDQLQEGPHFVVTGVDRSRVAGADLTSVRSASRRPTGGVGPGTNPCGSTPRSKWPRLRQWVDR